MGKKILIAGAGHGGVAAAAQLSKAGFDVTILERHTQDELGYDWFDAVNPAIFHKIGCPHPEEAGIPWQWRADVTYFGPHTSDERKIPQRFTKQEQIEIVMERKDIYKLLCSYALDCGAKIEYGVTVVKPLVQNGRVVGVGTDKGDSYADLVIDAAGLFSPLRTQLPDDFGIQKAVEKNERIYTYRAFYDLPVPAETVKDVFKVMFRPDEGDDFGLSWIYTRDTYADLLIGHVEPPTTQEIDSIADEYRKTNPQLGKTKLRGGQTVPIPFRRPLSVLVADGYAAIGDAAFMTMPLNCSGMSVSLETSVILVEAILADKTETYSAATLWKYQYDFFKKIGKSMGPIALVKDMIVSLSQEQLDYAFDSGIITYRELTITAYQHSIFQFLHFDWKLPCRGVKLWKDKDMRKKALATAKDVVAALRVTGKIPKRYDRDAVLRWAKRYDDVYTRRYPLLFPSQQTKQ